MRRLISVAAFALALAVPVWAQRGAHGGGGGHVGGGMHVGGFAGHAGGGIGGGRSFSGMRSGGMRSSGMRSSPAFSRGPNRSFNRGFTRAPFRDRGFRDRGFRNRGFGDRGFRGRRFRDFDDFGFNNCFGFACNNFAWGSPWWGWGWYDPWLWGSWDEEDRRFDDEYYRQYDMADRWNEENLEEQRRLRQEERDGDQDSYAPRSSNRRSAADTSNQTPEPVAATVLVFRDQHKQEVQNYAIVGQTLWAFSAGHTQKIPLANLDIPATEKANDDRGVTFHVPGANEGQ
jgi:hypothetical protein